MVERAAAAFFVLVLAAIAIFASNRWNEDKHPLLVNSSCGGVNPCLYVNCKRPDTRKWA